MKVLILIAHVDSKGQSHAHQIAEASRQALEAAGHEVRVCDLIKSGFDQCLKESDFVKVSRNPRLVAYDEFRKGNLSQEIERQLDDLQWATHVIACGPMWWLNFPSCFYIWMEKMLTSIGTRYPGSSLYENGPNKGKKIMLCITTANPNFSHGSNLTSVDGIFYQTLIGLHGSGFTVLRSQPFLGCAYQSDDEFNKTLERWKKEVLNIDSREAIEFHRTGGLNSQGLDGAQLICGLPNPTF